jgi:hypothetical protein
VSVYIPLCLSICLSVWLPYFVKYLVATGVTYDGFSLSVCPRISFYFRHSADSVCNYFGMSVCFSAVFLTSMFVNPSTYLSVYLYVCPSVVHLSIYLFVCIDCQHSLLFLFCYFMVASCRAKERGAVNYISQSW